MLLLSLVIKGVSDHKAYNETKQRLFSMYAHTTYRNDTPAPEIADTAKKEFTEMARREDPGIALQAVESAAKSDSAAVDYCHLLTHEIGHVAYEKYGDFSKAMQYQNNVCNSGFLHGVIESHFPKSENVFSDMETVCARDRLGSLSSVNCYHGVGHGLMYYTSNDLPRSLDMCDSYGNEFARSHCAIGVFMENVNTDGKLHPSKFIREDNLFYPCGEQELHFKHECYFYTAKRYLTLYPDDYIGALRWCEGAEIFFRSTCAKAVGGYAMKRNSDSPKYVEGVCMSNKKSQRSPCLDGMVIFTVSYFRSLESAEALCAQLEPYNQRACHRAVRAKSSLFAD